MRFGAIFLFCGSGRLSGCEIITSKYIFDSCDSLLAFHFFPVLHMLLMQESTTLGNVMTNTQMRMNIHTYIHIRTKWEIIGKNEIKIQSQTSNTNPYIHFLYEFFLCIFCLFFYSFSSKFTWKIHMAIAIMCTIWISRIFVQLNYMRKSLLFFL